MNGPEGIRGRIATDSEIVPSVTNPHKTGKMLVEELTHKNGMTLVFDPPIPVPPRQTLRFRVGWNSSLEIYVYGMELKGHHWWSRWRVLPGALPIIKGEDHPSS